MRFAGDQGSYTNVAILRLVQSTRVSSHTLSLLADECALGTYYK